MTQNKKSNTFNCQKKNMFNCYSIDIKKKYQNCKTRALARVKKNKKYVKWKKLLFWQLVAKKVGRDSFAVSGVPGFGDQREPKGGKNKNTN